MAWDWKEVRLLLRHSLLRWIYPIYICTQDNTHKMEMNHFAGDVINIIIIPVSECDKKSTQKEIDNIYVGGLKSGNW